MDRKAAQRNFASLRRCGKVHFGSPVSRLRRSREYHIELFERFLREMEYNYLFTEKYDKDAYCIYLNEE
jgi:hypothetical protein